MTPASTIPFWSALRFWLKLGFISFGGPAGQIAIMHAELVQRRRWISERRFLHALNYCTLLPGPEAQQLATYLGWLMHRTAGGVAAGLLFVLPSWLILVALSWAYLALGQVSVVAGVFGGLKPAVLAIVLLAVWRLGRRTLHNAALVSIAVLAFVALAALQLPFPAIVLGAALAGAVGGRLAPRWFDGPAAAAPETDATSPALIGDTTPPPPHARFEGGRLAAVLGIGVAMGVAPWAALVAWQGGPGLLSQLAWFFTKAALLTFGGAYAVLPYVDQGAVLTHGWLSAAQMMDGLALGETTPGPLIMVVAFVGFVAGWQHPEMQALLGPQHPLAGALLAAWVVTWFSFLPSFLFSWRVRRGWSRRGTGPV